MDNGPSKLVAGALNLCLVLPAVVMLYAVIAAPVASAEADCDVPASNPPGIDQYFEETSVDSGGFWGWGLCLIPISEPTRRDASADAGFCV